MSWIAPVRGYEILAVMWGISMLPGQEMAMTAVLFVSVRSSQTLLLVEIHTATNKKPEDRHITPMTSPNDAPYIYRTV